jgi:hypothetical protein
VADTSAKVIITAQDATTAGLRSVERNLRGMQKEAQSLSGSLKSMAGALGISLGVSTAISGIQRFVSSTIELADSMGKTAEQTGLTIEEISALRFAAEQADVEFGTLQSSLTKFNRTIAEAGSGNKAAKDAFLQLGISMETVKATKSEDLFMLVAQRVSELGSETDRTKALVDVFGRSGAELAPLFSQGAEGITKAKEAAKELGVVISGEANDKVRKLGDQADLLSKKWDAFATNLLGRSAPTIIRALDVIQKQLERPFLEQFLRNLSGVSLAEMGAALTGMGADAASGSTRGTINRARPAPAPTGRLRDLAGEEESRKRQLATAKEAGDLQDKLNQDERQFAEWLNGQTENYADMTIRGIEAEMEVRRESADEWRAWTKEQEASLGMLGELGAQAARNIQDSFAQFLFDPFKGGLGGMLKGFINTIRRMIAEVASAMLLKQFFTWMSGLSGGFGQIGSALLAGMGKANGGPVMGNRAYMVGERGPEMFVPSSGGSIVPNNRMGGGVTVAPVYNVDARGATADLVKALPAILEANTRRAVELARATIYDDYSRGAFGRA